MIDTICTLKDDRSREAVVPGQAGGSRTKLKFGAFNPPHHPPDEHPTLQLRRDLDFAVHLDRLGFDEFWCGEHHSSGWGMIGSPELFLAAAGERTQRIRLGTGVVSLPYHHPFNVAERIVQLDHLTNGRVIFGTGPGASPADARTFGIDPILLRNRQDDALGVIIRLLRGERFSCRKDWFILNDAQLQLLPLQEPLPMAAASSISPSEHAACRKVWNGRAVDRFDHDRRPASSAAPMVVCRRGRVEAWPLGRPAKLARTRGLPSG